MIDGYGRVIADCDRWREAENLEDLGTLTAAWLDGSISCHPMNLGPAPDAETSSITTPLVKINLSGFVTDLSQPGTAPEADSVQRAAISGFCAEPVAEKILDQTARSDLVVLAHPPGVESYAQIPITVDAGRPYTWIGATMPTDYLVYSSDGMLSEAALLALTSAWQVQAFDPEWGRNDRLWSAIVAALETIRSPDPGLAV